jgi:glycosyltransferase involved in cell wall biosynthesis
MDGEVDPTRASATAAEGVDVAVCVCTCNRQASLERLLERLGAAGLEGLAPDRVSLVVVDNAPGGAAAGLCRDHRARLGVPLHYVEEPERGISFARNSAIGTALGQGAELVAFVDDDDLPEPDWLRQLLLRQRQTSADLVFGLATMPAGIEIPPALRHIPDFRPRSLEAVNRWGLPAAAGTCNVLLHRRLLLGLAAEGRVFLPELALTGGGDTELFVRAHKRGFRSAVAPASVVVTGWEAGRWTVRGTLRRSYRYGVSQTTVACLHLDAKELRRLRRGTPRRLLKLVLRLPLSAFSRARAVARLADLAREIGKLSAFYGGRYRYYR